LKKYAIDTCGGKKIRRCKKKKDEVHLGRSGRTIEGYDSAQKAPRQKIGAKYVAGRGSGGRSETETELGPLPCTTVLVIQG